MTGTLGCCVLLWMTVLWVWFFVKHLSICAPAGSCFLFSSSTNDHFMHFIDSLYFRSAVWHVTWGKSFFLKDNYYNPTSFNLMTFQGLVLHETSQFLAGTALYVNKGDWVRSQNLIQGFPTRSLLARYWRRGFCSGLNVKKRTNCIKKKITSLCVPFWFFASLSQMSGNPGMTIIFQ